MEFNNPTTVTNMATMTEGGHMQVVSGQGHRGSSVTDPDRAVVVWKFLSLEESELRTKRLLNTLTKIERRINKQRATSARTEK